VPAAFARWSLAGARPAYYRLMIDWSQLQPDADRPPDFERPANGCMRTVEPCAPWRGVREQLEALAARQRGGGWEALVVLWGTPSWAARPAAGCERAGTEPRSRMPRADALPAYERVVAAILAEAARAGVRLRFWSPWNEPNHPFSASPQRARCAGGAATEAPGPYAEVAAALRRALGRAGGGRELVLGELAGFIARRPRSTTVGELVAGLPRELVCAAPVVSVHAYLGGPDPVDALGAALGAHGCRRAPQVWITETGVDRARGASAAAARTACEAYGRRLERWYRDPRVTAAFQYTLREDDRFRTGLVATDLRAAFPQLGLWRAWSAAARPRPSDPPPQGACAATGPS